MVMAEVAEVDWVYVARQWILLQPDVAVAFALLMYSVAQLRRVLQIFVMVLFCLMNLVMMLVERRLDVHFLFRLDDFCVSLLNNGKPITISDRNYEATKQALSVFKLTILLNQIRIDRVFCFIGRAVHTATSLALFFRLVSIQFGIQSTNARKAKVIFSSIWFAFADQSVLLVVEYSKSMVILFATAVRTNQLIAVNKTSRVWRWLR